jgi:hypothetical protein
MTSALNNILQDSRIVAMCSTLRTLNALTETAFRQAVRGLQPPLVPPVLQFLDASSWADVERAVDQVLAYAAGQSRPLKEEEFESLRLAATNGAVPVASSQVGTPPLFEVRQAEVRTVAGPENRVLFRIVPVNRLRMVLVQTGYRRLDPAIAQTVSTGFLWSGRTWYPGVELFGEGVYLDLADADIGLTGNRVAAWQNAYQGSNPTDDTLDPVYIWWHTLSHRLLRALSVDSGYSSASIRERVYVQSRPGAESRGGLLLYTVQPGGDGTLGGLIGLVPVFEQVISSAFRDLPTCSNDPLCEENFPNGINGSACYSCLFSSETSCELRNIHLDRGLLLENMP